MGDNTYRGCIMLSTDFDISSFLESIPASDLHEKGIEDDTHMTLIYGINGIVHEAPELLNWIMASKFPPRLIVDSDVSLFEGEQYDVLKIKIKQTLPIKTLREESIRDFDNKQQFGDYAPHMTLAYLKPGRGAKYVGLLKNSRRVVNVTNITYSDWNFKFRFHYKPSK